jgi:cytidylate kinase
MAASVVCISRSAAAGGEEIGRLVAERLGFRFVDEEIVARAAEREGLDVKDVASAEQRKGWLARFFEGGGGGRSPEMAGFGIFGTLGPGHLGSSEAYRELIKDAILQTAEQGSVVIVAHAASYALAGREDVLRVFVTASPAVRSRRLAEALGVDEEAAIKKVKESDAARADYLKRFYEIDHELPTHYDLVVNTERLGTDQAVVLVSQAAGATPRP